jgi:hypothetical protein
VCRDKQTPSDFREGKPNKFSWSAKLKMVSIINGTIQATQPCDLKTFQSRLTWLGMLALDKTEQKSRSPNRAFPE